MQPNHINAQLQNPPNSDSLTSGALEVSELALLIDAIPLEYREDVLLAVLYLAENDSLEQSHFVSLYRERLQDCLLGMTGTSPNLQALRQSDRAAIRRRLTPLATAEDPAQVTVALCRLLDFLNDTI